MKVSIVTAILNSHEIVRRQALHYAKMPLPSGVEVIWVDDGSDPSIKGFLQHPKDFPLTILETHDKRKWTQPAARNFGVSRAKGEFLILTDIDHIVPRELIEAALTCPYDVLRLRREAAVLNALGEMSQDLNTLEEYGLLPKYLENKLKLPPHGNSMIIRKELYEKLEGVDESKVGSGIYPNREEVILKRRLKILEQRGEVEIFEGFGKPTIYMIPNGRYCGDKDANPFGLFHSLSRKNNRERRGGRRFRMTNKEKRRLRNEQQGETSVRPD